MYTIWWAAVDAVNITDDGWFYLPRTVGEGRRLAGRCKVRLGKVYGQPQHATATAV